MYLTAGSLSDIEVAITVRGAGQNYQVACTLTNIVVGSNKLTQL
jgi:hypothetical protein